MSPNKKLYRSTPSLIFIALMSIYSANTVAMPCQSLPGMWQGRWDASLCSFDVSVNADIDKTNVRFILKISNPNDGCKIMDVDQFTMDGVCEDGNLSLEYPVPGLSKKDYPLKGTIVGTVMTIEGDNEHAVLHKK